MSMTESRSHGRSGPIAGPGVGRHLLIVDDDDRIRELLKEFLAREGYRVTGAAHAAAAKRMMELIEFDLVVLDVMMPGESGLDLTTWVRNKAELSKTPVLLLTARGDAEDRIEGLSRGADDYMSKPFEPRELVARIRTVLRRTGGEATAIEGRHADFSGWSLDIAARALTAPDGRLAPLSGADFDLLHALVRNGGKPLSRERIADEMHRAWVQFATTGDPGWAPIGDAGEVRRFS